MSRGNTSPRSDGRGVTRHRALFGGNVGASLANSPDGAVTAVTFTIGPSWAGRVTTTEVTTTVIPSLTTFNCSDVIP